MKDAELQLRLNNARTDHDAMVIAWDYFRASLAITHTSAAKQNELRREITELLIRCCHDLFK